MIIQGRVAEILEPRTGTRSDGTEWKEQSFVVEFFEHDTDLSPQSVLLRTYDSKVADNLLKEMIVKCTISHKAEHWRSKEGDKEGWSPRTRLHNITCVSMPGKRSSFMPEAAVAAPQAQPQAQAAPVSEPDDLPF
jgi:hypothetical protein